MSSSSRPTALFDLDGTLVDSRASVASCLNAALEEHGLEPFPEATLHPYVGAPIHDILTDLLTRRDALERVGADAGVATFRAIYGPRSVVETRTFAGIPEALVELSRTHRLMVATTKPQAAAAPIVEAVGLGSVLDAVVGPALEARSEPKTATLARALATAPGPAVLVGDTSFDVVAAHGNGVPVIGVTWGIGSAEELREAGADVLVGAPGELPDAVRRATGTGAAR